MRQQQQRAERAQATLTASLNVKRAELKHIQESLAGRIIHIEQLGSSELLVSEYTLCHSI